VPLEDTNTLCALGRLANAYYYNLCCQHLKIILIRFDFFLLILSFLVSLCMHSTAQHSIAQHSTAAKKRGPGTVQLQKKKKKKKKKKKNKILCG